MDCPGERRGARAWYSRKSQCIDISEGEILLDVLGLSGILGPNCFFHISCIEHLFDLRELLDEGWVTREGGTCIVGMWQNAVMEMRFPTLVEEWFKNRGAVFTVNEYKAYEAACKNQEDDSGEAWMRHQRCEQNARGGKAEGCWILVIPFF